MPSAHSVKLRPLEREDLRYVHQLDNNASVMRYWFEDPDKYRGIRITAFSLLLERTGTILERTAERTE